MKTAAPQITITRNEFTDVVTATVAAAPHLRSSKDFHQGWIESQTRQRHRAERWAEKELQRLNEAAYQEMAT